MSIEEIIQDIRAELSVFDAQLFDGLAGRMRPVFAKIQRGDAPKLRSQVAEMRVQLSELRESIRLKDADIVQRQFRIECLEEEIKSLKRRQKKARKAIPAKPSNGTWFVPKSTRREVPL